MHNSEEQRENCTKHQEDVFHGYREVRECKRMMEEEKEERGDKRGKMKLRERYVVI